jgi:hypothetical protein
MKGKANKKNVKKSDFKSFYEGLPANEQLNFRSEVMKLASISLDTFYRRLNNPGLFSVAEARAITGIIPNKKMSEVFGFQPLKVA